MSILKYFQNKKKSETSSQNQKSEKKSQEQIYLSKDININIEIIKNFMGNSSDILVREFTITPDAEIKAAIILITGMAGRELVNDQVIGALMLNERLNNAKTSWELFDIVKEYGIPNIYISEGSDIQNIITELINGNTILLLDQVNRALVIGSQGWKDRAISEPVTENVVRGPRDGFTENIESNIALIRRRIKSTDLRVESLKVGTETKTMVSLVYLQSIAREEIVREAKSRLKRIKINGILESGYIEELIEDTPASPFPQIEHSERPDKVSAAILEGRIAIIVDTTPFVLIIPAIFFHFIQSADDYYERFPIGSLTRAVRILAYFISVILPSLYIALTSFHHEMIPTPLALSIAASREGVPFPSIGEAFIMEATFEILREAGLRLPRQAGQAVSIVGGLVIGQSAVQAGIISQAMVIIVSLTGISSFAIPAFNAAASGRLLRFPLMLFASVLGLPGILAGLSIIIVHMNSLRSFGVSYMEPFISSNRKEFKDMVIRSPWWKMTRLPGYIASKEKIRVSPDIKPGPEEDSKGNGNSK